MSKRTELVTIIIMTVVAIALLVGSIVIAWEYVGVLALTKESYAFLIHSGHSLIALITLIMDISALILLGSVRILLKTSKKC